MFSTSGLLKDVNIVGYAYDYKLYSDTVLCDSDRRSTCQILIICNRIALRGSPVHSVSGSPIGRYILVAALHETLNIWFCAYGAQVAQIDSKKNANE